MNGQKGFFTETLHHQLLDAYSPFPAAPNSGLWIISQNPGKSLCLADLSTVELISSVYHWQPGNQADIGPKA
jgi:hypothetical protein